MPSLICCGYCCGGFSLFGLLFMLVVGAVIDSGSETIQVSIDRSTAASNCFTAAGIYGGFIGLSIAMLIAGKYRSRRSSNGTQQPLLNQKAE